MAHVHAPVLRSNDELTQRAKNIHPLKLAGRVSVTVLSALFIALGWAIGRSWFTLVFTVLWTGSRLSWLGSCIHMGYALGRKHNIVPERE